MQLQHRKTEAYLPAVYAHIKPLAQCYASLGAAGVRALQKWALWDYKLDNTYLYVMSGVILPSLEKQKDCKDKPFLNVSA